MRTSAIGRPFTIVEVAPLTPPKLWTAGGRRSAQKIDGLAASLPDDLREIFEARPDVHSLRQRLAPA